jgi:hypothetical protein
LLSESAVLVEDAGGFEGRPEVWGVDTKRGRGLGGDELEGDLLSRPL